MLEIKSKEELNNKISLDKNVLVKMSELWCSSCRRMAIVMKSLENKYPDIMFCELDLDKVPVYDDYNIDQLPAIILFRNGKEVARYDESKDFEEWLKSI